MRIPFLVLVFILLSCDNRLSSEQRQKIRENMDKGKIRKVSDAQITSAAFSAGKKVTDILTSIDPDWQNSSLRDSLAKANNIEILILSDESVLRKQEREILEAYKAASGSYALADNVQKTSKDSILYTMPVVKNNTFAKALGIRFTVKQLVLSINE